MCRIALSPLHEVSARGLSTRSQHEVVRALIRDERRGDESSVGESSPSRQGSGGDGPAASARHGGAWGRAEVARWLPAERAAATAAGEEKPSTSTQPLMKEVMSP